MQIHTICWQCSDDIVWHSQWSLSACRLLKRLDFPEMMFSLYFVGYEKAEDIPTDDTERTRWTFTRKATVELTQYVIH